MLGSVNNNINVITSGPNMISGGPGSGGPSNIAQNNSGSSGHEENLKFLFSLNAIEVRDDYEEKMFRNYIYVQGKLLNKSEQQAHEELNKITSQSAILYEEVTMGLLVSMLLEPNNALRYYRDLTHLNRDGLNYFTTNIILIISERYQHLHDYSRRQLLWLLKEMLRNQVSNIEIIFYNMFRNVVGGDISPNNNALNEALLDILIELRPFYYQNSQLLSFALFHYLRMIADHQSQTLKDLRNKEIQYCLLLLKENFGEFLWIGRDLIRLLQQVATIAEFEKFWAELLNNPGSLAPGFTGILQIMKIRTPRRFIKLRITFDLEKKLMFLTSQVRFGHHRRYQEWIQKQYFSSQESQMLRCDMIRFICCSIHPSNETLASDIFPRWALIGWLLSVSGTHALASYAKLALFYDWFFFDDREPQSIMDIEPGILVMYYSLKNYPAITSGLIDFLCRISNEFHSSLSSHIKQGIKASLQRIFDMKVLTSASLVFDSNKLDADVRQLFRDNFSDLVDSISPPQVMQPYGGSQIGQQPTGQGAPNLQIINKYGSIGQPVLPSGSQSSGIQINNYAPDSSTTANFSDDEDDSNGYNLSNGPPLKKLKKSNNFSNGSNSRNINRPEESSSSIVIPNASSISAQTNNSVEYITSIINNSVQNSNNFANNGSNGNILINNSLGNNMNMLNDLSNNVSNHIGMLNNNCLNNSDNFSASSLVSGDSTITREELLDQIEHLPNIAMRSCLNKLFHEKSKDMRCQEMQKLTKLILDDDSDEYEESSTSLTIILLAILEDDLSVRIFPFDYTKPSSIPDDKELKESITGPLFVMFRALAESSEEDQSNQSSLMTLVAAMGTNNSKVGYLLIYFLIVANFMAPRMSIYRHYAREMSKELGDSLLSDLRCCAYDDVYMFFYLLPEIFLNLSFTLIGTTTDLIKLIVSHADSVQLQSILSRIISGSIKLVRKEGTIAILTTSLEWNSVEQYYVWQIISAHNVSVDQVIPILNKLEYNVHSEALSNLMLFVQREAPTSNLIKHLFNRESKSGDSFTVSILIHWAQQYPEKLAELIGNFISTKISSPNKRNKRTLNTVAKSQVNLSSNIELILYYLEEMRKTSKNSNFFTQGFMIIVLDQLKQLCSSSQKTKYQELFANLPDDNENSKDSSNSGPSTSSANSNSKKATSSASNNKKNPPLSKTRSGNTISNRNNDSATESESSDEEPNRSTKSKSNVNARKKRKQAIDSDSD